MKRVSDWIVVDGYCAARIVEGGDIDKMADRVAFIEKTPRVRIRTYGAGCMDARDARNRDSLNWCEGNEWKASGCGGDQDAAKLGAYGFDVQARAWCDRMLVAMGYQLPGMADLGGQWESAYAAFKGAFDNPLARRLANDEFSQDARRRLSDFNDRMRSLDPEAGTRRWVDSAGDGVVQQVRKCLYCERDMIVGSECTSASQSGDCAVRAQGSGQ